MGKTDSPLMKIYKKYYEYAGTEKEWLDDLINGRLGTGSPVQPSGQFEFTLARDGTYYILSGIGTVTDEDIVIPSTYNGLPVMEIGNSAFSEYQFIRSVVIPEGVTRIWDGFSGCTKLEAVTLPTTLELIGPNAFANCSSLASIEIPEGVTEIHQNAFSGCTKLETVTLPTTLELIGSSAFSNCSSLASIEIPEGVTEIGGSVFAYSALTEVSLPEGWTDPGFQTFMNCISLKKINFPSTLTRISWQAFMGCISLEEIEIPEGVTVIATFAFWGCTSLKRVTLPSTLSELAENAFEGCDEGIYEKENGLTYLSIWLMKGDQSVVNAVVREGTCGIINRAFYECGNLKTVTLPQSLRSIGSSTFFGCSQLTEIVIPEGVTEIPDSAFNGCTKLETVTLPTSSKTDWSKCIFWLQFFDFNRDTGRRD